MGKEPGDFQGLSFEEEAEEEEKTKRIPRNRENVFGPIPGIEVGKVWSTRLECSADGIHRPTVAGIHGNASEGCYSLALSGGYEDDIDYGECFTYTGEGGRDLKGTKSNPKNLRTAPQSKDQTLTRGNLALTKNVEKGLPVRVIRGYKLDSPFAPEEGYRYDGLYTVEKYWQSVGLSGFMVYKFALKRADNQPPAVWHSIDNEDESVVEGDPEVLVGDSTASESKSPSKDNKDHEISAVVHDDGEGNDADHGDEKMTSEYDANVNDVNEKNASENNENEKCEDEKRKEKNATENGVDQNGADVCYTRQDDEKNTDVNTNSPENDELKNDQSNQDGDEYLPAGSVCEDDHNMNTTSSQQDNSAEHSNAKAIQDENNDVNHVTDATRQEDSSEQTSVAAAQDENNDDDNDVNHVTDTTRQEDSSEQTSVITTQDENDADENHVIKAKRLEADSNEQRQ